MALNSKVWRLVEFAHFPYKSGATQFGFALNAFRNAFQATLGVAGYMRRRETKCKKPLVSTQLLANSSA